MIFNRKNLDTRRISFLKAELETLRALTLQVFENQLYVKEFEPCLTSEGFRRLFSLIGRNSQGISLNLLFKF